MPRKAINAEQQKTETATVETQAAEQQKTEEIPAYVEKLMKLYTQYESFYVTSTGFVHTVDAPKYLIKDAVLYKNKYFKS